MWGQFNNINDKYELKKPVLMKMLNDINDSIIDSINKNTFQ